MALERNFDELTYGDPTRQSGDYVGLPHDEENDEIPVGRAVTFDGSIIAECTGDTDSLVGVLSNYPVYGENNTVDQDQDATIKTHGTVKAEVESDVSAGDALTAGETTDGVFDTQETETQDASAVALSDAKQDDRDDDTAYYAEVLLK